MSEARPTKKAAKKAAAAKAAAKKRGPGRPPKRQAPPPLAKKGVVEAPDSTENRLELVYGGPMMFKVMFAYFKNLKARDIHIRCAPGGLVFFTRDSSRACRIVAKIPGAETNHYYCEDTFWLGLNRESVEKIFASIDRSFYKVTLSFRHDDEEHLTILFKDPDLEKECKYQTRVTVLDRDEDLFAAEALTTPESLRAFPIALALGAKQFKKTVTDAAHHSDRIMVEKLARYPLQFTYSKAGMMYHEIYLNPAKIELRSAVPEDGIFRCTLKIADIKSLASAMVTSRIRIFCREDADTLFRAKIEALEVNTLTRLVEP